MAGKKGMRHYSVALKEQAVHLALTEARTATEIAVMLELREASQVAVWVRAYRREGKAGLCKPQGRPRQMPQSELARLQMENALLKKWHSELRGPMRAKRNIGLLSTIALSMR